MGELSILAPSGAEKYFWDSGNPDEVKQVKNRFSQFLEKGYSAFQVNNVQGEGKKILFFDAFAEKIIMVPKLGGG